MRKLDRICLFYHREGGRRGCSRADCPFIHSIQDRLNDFFDGVAGGLTTKSIQTLLDKAELHPETAAQVYKDTRVPDAHQESRIFNALALELMQEIAAENASEAVADAVTAFRTEVAATASVVEAVATTEDAPCPYLRFSLFAELERSCAGMRELVDDMPVLGANADRAGWHMPQNFSRALAAFEARKLLEEQA